MKAIVAAVFATSCSPAERLPRRETAPTSIRGHESFTGQSQERPASETRRRQPLRPGISHAHAQAYFNLGGSASCDLHRRAPHRGRRCRGRVSAFEELALARPGDGPGTAASAVADSVSSGPSRSLRALAAPRGRFSFNSAAGAGATGGASSAAATGVGAGRPRSSHAATSLSSETAPDLVGRPQQVRRHGNGGVGVVAHVVVESVRHGEHRIGDPHRAEPSAGWRRGHRAA